MTRKLHQRAFQAAVIALAFSVFVPAAQAEHQFELVAGYYFTSDIELPNLGTDLGYSNVFTPGLRYGYRSAGKLGFGLEYTHVNLDSGRAQQEALQCSRCSLDLDFVDFSLEYYPGGGKFAIFGGPGWVTSDVTVRLEGPSNNLNASDDSFTFHVGISYMAEVGEKFYIRPEFRYRYLSLDSGGAARYDNNDPQLGIGFGWRF